MTKPNWRDPNMPVSALDRDEQGKITQIYVTPERASEWARKRLHQPLPTYNVDPTYNLRKKPNDNR